MLTADPQSLSVAGIDAPPHGDDLAAAQNALGMDLRDAGDVAGAAKAFMRALHLRPRYPEATLNLADALALAGKAEEAATCYRAVLIFDPKNIAAANNLGRAPQVQGRLDEALTQFEEAIALAPENGDLHYNRALLLLLMGRPQEGWAEHEWRWKAASFLGRRRNLAQPPWDGSEQPGATLLLYAEQGLGDAIQFARYASVARGRVGRVILEVPRPLIGLLGNLAGVDQLVATGDALPEFDCQAPLMSLPHLLGEEIGLPIPYLAADPERVQRWTARLGEGSPRVGLVWAGNPRPGNDRDRALPATALRPLIEAGGARFFSLQLAPRYADLVAAGLGDRVTDLSAELTDLAEMAAALSALDLLIAVDTAAVHLAGALGRAVWLMLPFAPDWRWGTAGPTTRWYPQMCLFRQDRPGVWDPVIAELANQLNAIV